MNRKEIEALESYYKTDNEHWNSYAFRLFCEVIQIGNIEPLEQPLRLFSDAIEVFLSHPGASLEAVNIIAIELDKSNISSTSKLLVYKWIIKYLSESEFDNCETIEVVQILKSKVAMMLQDSEGKNRVYTMDIRETLKRIINEELISFNNTLEKLEPLERLQIVCKLIPYIVPKSQSIHPTYNEQKNYSLEI